MIKVSDRIKIVNYAELPKEFRTKEISKFCNKQGFVTNKKYSPTSQGYLYNVVFDENLVPSTINFPEELLKKITIDRLYLDCIVDDRLVIARLFDDTNKLVMDGHGHIFDGNNEERTLQAAAFAFNRLWRNYKALKKSV